MEVQDYSGNHQDKWCEALVVECISIAAIDMDTGFAMPGIEDSQKEILEKLKQHGLDEIEIEKPSIEIRMHSADEEEVELTDDPETADKAKEQSARILALLDTNENRKAIIQDLWKARSGSPFSVACLEAKWKRKKPQRGKSC